MNNNLIQHIRKYIDLSDSEVLVLNEYSETHKLAKKQFILQEGKVCKHLHFVEKGCLRMYFINKKEVEQIAQFALDGWWISDYQSFMNQTPSDYYIQTIEESIIVTIDYQKLDELLNELPQFEKYFRKIMQKKHS